MVNTFLSIFYFVLIVSISYGGEIEYLQEVDQNDDFVFFVVMDGTNESIFRKLLEKGALKYLNQLLKRKNKDGSWRSIYSSATSVWPSTTGPAYAPFITGNFPSKSDLSGIRQFIREKNLFRNYAGSELLEISSDLSKTYPTIYEILGDYESINQQGFVARKGWAPNGKAYPPYVSHNTAIIGALKKAIEHNEQQFDATNLVSLLLTTLPNSSYSNYKNIHKPLMDNLVKEFPDFNLSRLMQKYIANNTVGVINREFKQAFGRPEEGHNPEKVPKFSFIGFHLPDATSHQFGTRIKDPGSYYTKYEKALIEMDQLIGALIRFLENVGVFDRTTFIFTADHGTSTVNEDLDPKKYHVRLVEKFSHDTLIPIKDPGPDRFSWSFIKGWQEKAGEWDYSLLKEYFYDGPFRILEDEPGYKQYAGLAAVSGNAHVQFYIKAPDAIEFTERPSYRELRNYPNIKGQKIDLIERLLKYEVVQNVYVREKETNSYHIFRKRDGRTLHGTIKKQGNNNILYKYEVEEIGDPLELINVSERFRKLTFSNEFYSGDEWAATTRNTNYPDAIVQIPQLLDGKNSGDIIIDAAPGYEPWDEMQAGLHGALREEHIRVPLLISSPRLEFESASKILNNSSLRFARTVDMYPTILSLLNKKLPSKISYYRKHGNRNSKWRKVISPVLKNIDGKRLDIWKETN